MAVDKLVDSTQLDADLTSVADAIRTKGGTSASLAFPAGFVSAINDISGSGGIDPSWGSTSEVVTVGVNTVTKGDQVATFFSQYTFTMAVLITKLDTDNQVVTFDKNANSAKLRWRWGSIVSFSTTSSYDAILKKDSQYLLLKR